MLVSKGSQAGLLRQNGSSAASTSRRSIFSDSWQKHVLLGFEVHGEFEAGTDKVEEDCEEVAGDVDDEASSGRELAEDEAVDGDAMIEREYFRNH